MKKKVHFNLNTFFSDLQEEMVDMITSHKIVFTVPNGITLSADREKIAQVVKNLIGNAVKYSPAESRITVSCAKIDVAEVLISVTDEGMGISPEDQEHIFERYFRVKSNKMGLISGFGIGLYLCKEIVELHGGKISVESDGQSGSTFSFSIPL